MRAGQCVLNAAGTLFGWFRQTPQQGVLLSQLYIRAPRGATGTSEDASIVWAPEEASARLFLTDVTLQGGRGGLHAAALCQTGEGCARVRVIDGLFFDASSAAITLDSAAVLLEATMLIGNAAGLEVRGVGRVFAIDSALSGNAEDVVMPSSQAVVFADRATGPLVVAPSSAGSVQRLTPPDRAAFPPDDDPLLTTLQTVRGLLMHAHCE